MRTKARDHGTVIYAIGLRSAVFNGRRTVRSQASGTLRQLAEETGGGFVEPKLATELPSTVAQVADELHSLYALGFMPATLDEERHKLEIRVQRGLTVHARRGYLASPGLLEGVN